MDQNNPGDENPNAVKRRRDGVGVLGIFVDKEEEYTYMKVKERRSLE